MSLGFLDFRSNLVRFGRRVVGSGILYTYLSRYLLELQSHPMGW